MSDGSDPRAEQRVGSVLNEKWTLEHLIGSGGMGAVYAARHRNGARSAVKVLHPELARLPDVRERFLREGYAANRVEHRGVVQVLDDDIVKGGPDDGSAYLVMELLEGESLQERAMRSPKLTERELLEVMDAVLDVLHAAHQHGVVHRDLKPENIFLAKDPERDGVRVKVLDFGLARLAEASGVTNAGMAVGTPSFMSPEQAAGRSLEIDGRTDIFALGATIFRIVTGRRIHDADNMVQLVVLMASNPAPPLRTILPSASVPFARVVDKALTFERDDRPHAKPMSEIVRAAIEELGPLTTTDDDALVVIPFSARNVRVGSSAEIVKNSDSPAKVTDPIRPSSDEKEAGWFEDSKGEDKRASAVDPEEESPKKRAQPTSDPPPPDSERPAKRKSPPPPPKQKSATLPWFIVLVLLGIGMWRLLPSLQDELVQRARVWVSAPSLKPSADPAASSTATSETTPTNANAADADAGALALEFDDDDDAGVMDDDATAPEASNPPDDAAHDAAAAAAAHNAAPPSTSAAKPPTTTASHPPPPPPTVATRPHPPTTSHGTQGKPPVKKPPQPPPRPGTKRKH